MEKTSGDACKPVPAQARTHGPLVYRQSGWTRLTHWIWATSLFFLLLSGLQIFNAHPTLYLGDQSGFGFDNGVLSISGFPAWATIPSGQDLATGRVVHFFFAWILSGTLLVWLIAGLVNGHIRRELAPGIADLRRLPHDVLDHLKLKFHHTSEYNTLQKLAYAGVLFVLFPLMILTGLAMSPSMNAAVPFLADALGGRQTARTIHFVVMLLLVGFFLIHMLMIMAAGPINELRSIVTGWYRVDGKTDSTRRSG
jgi:thiosulfate reductase cytochrome b subunit